MLTTFRYERRKALDSRRSQLGYDAQKRGEPIDHCPFEQRRARSSWERGWIAAYHNRPRPDSVTLHRYAVTTVPHGSDYPDDRRATVTFTDRDDAMLFARRHLDAHRRGGQRLSFVSVFDTTESAILLDWRNDEAAA